MHEDGLKPQIGCGRRPGT